MGSLNSTPYFTKHTTGEETLSVFSGAGTVDRIRCKNGSASVVYLQFFDILTQPANGVTVPSFAPIAIPAGGYYESDTPLGFTTGCQAAISATQFVFGEGGSSDVWLDVGGGR
jgi:hypothetical protein